MKKQWKKAVSIGCTACMLVSTMPMSGLHLIAEAQGIETQSDEAATSGTWGTCEWNLDGDGVLTISGGVAESLGRDGASWKDICKEIQEVHITGNITFDEDNISLRELFRDCSNVTQIQGLDKLDTSKVTDMSRIIYDCENLTEIDVSGFNTNRVTNMDSMFYHCVALTKLDVSNFDTSQVTNMYDMFDACFDLTELDLSNFDTSQVTDMRGMFGICADLKKLDLSNFDTGRVTDMSGMFNACLSLEEIDLSNFNTSQVTNMSGMFNACLSLEEIDLSNFNTSQVTNMSEMFSECKNMEKIDLSNFGTSNVTDLSKMFLLCENLTEIDLSRFDTSNVTDMSEMFFDCYNLEKINLSGFDTSNVTDMWWMFLKCKSLKEVDLSGFDTSNVTNMSGMFSDCENLEKIDVSGFDTSNVISINSMFEHCHNLEKLDLSSFDLSRAYTSDMLAFSSLTDITVPKTYDEDGSLYLLLLDGMKFGKWKDVTDNISYETKPDKLQTGHRYVLTENAEVFGTWGNCDWEWQDGTLTVRGGVAQSTEDCPFISSEQLLRKADIQKVNITGDITFEDEETSLYELFKNCEILEKIDGLGNIDMSKVTNIEKMFYGCKALRQINMSGWDISRIKDCDIVFGECKFDLITMPDILGDNDTKRMFVGNLIFLEDTYNLNNDSNSSYTAFAPRGGWKSDLSDGPWCDVTAGIYYEGIPDMLDEGHTYVNTRVYKPQVDSENGVTIKKENGGVFDSDMELNVSDVTTNEDYADYADIANKLGNTNLMYDIALKKDGETIQPDGKILVSIPLPDNMSEEAKVYCITEDGTATDMNAVFADGYLTFATNHFSVYAVVDKNTVIGDVNGDGIFNMADAALVRRYVANLNVTIDTSAADVNKDGKIDMVDYALMRRALANWDVELK